MFYINNILNVTRNLKNENNNKKLRIRNCSEISDVKRHIVEMEIIFLGMKG
jgi:hypothetical protein